MNSSLPVGLVRFGMVRSIAVGVVPRDHVREHGPGELVSVRKNSLHWTESHLNPVLEFAPSSGIVMLDSSTQVNIAVFDRRRFSKTGTGFSSPWREAGSKRSGAYRDC